MITHTGSYEKHSSLSGEKALDWTGSTLLLFTSGEAEYIILGSIHKVRTHRGGEGGSPQKRTGAYRGERVSHQKRTYYFAFFFFGYF